MWWKVLKKPQNDKKHNVAAFLICLGVCDLIIIGLFVLNHSLPSLLPEVTTTRWYAWCYAYIGFPFWFLFARCSVCLIVAISFMRYLMIMYPLQRFKISETTNTKVIVIVFVCCFIGNLPHFLTIKPKYQANSTTATITLTQLGKSVHVMNYNFWSHCTLFVATPWMIIVMLNGAIIKRLRSNALNFDAQNAKWESYKRTTIVLLAVTFTFLGLLCWQCMSTCFFVIKSLHNYTGPFWYYVEESVAISKLLVAVNSCVNSVMYGFSGKTFREELLKMIKKRSSQVSCQPAPLIIRVDEASSTEAVEMMQLSSRSGRRCGLKI